MNNAKGTTEPKPNALPVRDFGHCKLFEVFKGVV